MELFNLHNRNLGRHAETHRQDTGPQAGTHEEVPPPFLNDSGSIALPVDGGYNRWPDQGEGYLPTVRVGSQGEGDTLWNLREDIGIMCESDDYLPRRHQVEGSRYIVFALPEIADPHQPEIQAFLPEMNCFVFEAVMPASLRLSATSSTPHQ